MPSLQEGISDCNRRPYFASHQHTSSYLSFLDERLASTERLLRDLADRVDHIERGDCQRSNVGQELARHIQGDLVDEASNSPIKVSRMLPIELGRSFFHRKKTLATLVRITPATATTAHPSTNVDPN